MNPHFRHYQSAYRRRTYKFDLPLIEKIADTEVHGQSFGKGIPRPEIEGRKSTQWSPVKIVVYGRISFHLTLRVFTRFGAYLRPTIKIILLYIAGTQHAIAFTLDHIREKQF